MWDAAGAAQPARLEVPSESQVRLVIDEATAVYPLVVDPLITRLASAQLESDQGFPSYFGVSVAGAGDVNGDDYDDVIVGAFLYDGGEADEGAAFVFHGSATGIADGDAATAAARLESNQAEAYFGGSVAGAGDVNRDGYDDVIVGAELYDHGETNEGAAFLFLGSATGVADGNPATASARLESDQSMETFDLIPGFGRSVASAGDVNDDGYDDVIVGALGYDNTRGAAFVFLGSATGVPDGDPTTAATAIVANGQNAAFGRSVAGAGDVNRDGYDDVIVGGATDRAFVFHGSAAGIPQTVPGSASAELMGTGVSGWSVDGAGDVNGDGYDDVVVDGDGSVYVFLGSAAGVVPVVAARLQPDLANSARYLGVVSGAGDLDADGNDDVIASNFDAAWAFL